MIESGNSTDVYSIYKEGTDGTAAVSASGTVATTPEALLFNLVVDNTFDDEITYIVSSGKT